MNDNKAIIISAAIMAGAIVLSSILILTRDNVPQPSSVVSKPSPTASPTDSPTVSPVDLAPIPSPSTSSEPPVIPSNPPVPSVVPAVPPSNSKPYSPPPTPFQPPSPRPIVSPLPSVIKNNAPTPVNTPANIQRPATDRFIQGYYHKLQSAQYQSAWQDLSGDFQSNRAANPGGYEGEYLKWWSSFGKNTKVKKIETMKLTPDKATVRAHCQFQGKSYITQYYLRFDTASGAWKIYGIDKLS